MTCSSLLLPTTILSVFFPASAFRTLPAVPLPSGNHPRIPPSQPYPTSSSSTHIRLRPDPDWRDLNAAAFPPVGFSRLHRPLRVRADPSKETLRDVMVASLAREERMQAKLHDDTPFIPQQDAALMLPLFQDNSAAILRREAVAATRPTSVVDLFHPGPGPSAAAGPAASAGVHLDEEDELVAASAALGSPYRSRGRGAQSPARGPRPAVGAFALSDGAAGRPGAPAARKNRWRGDAAE